MDTEMHHLSEEELANVIANAQRALKSKQHGKRREVISKIKELASSIGVSVEIIDEDKPASSLRGAKVPPKYRNPDNHEETWTGRGMKPRWMQAKIEQGRNPEEFLI